MSGKGIIQYRASDGSDVRLSPGIVAKYIVSGNGEASDKDLFVFMAKCQARGLNPLAGDAYMTTYRDKSGRTSSSVIVSKDYFVRTATQKETFDGMRAGVVVADRATGELTYREGSIVGKATEALVGGWAEVYDRRRSHPSRAEVSLAEYDQKRSLWLSKPATMIRKVALVQALREAYPGEFGGIYDGAEMPEPDLPAQVAEQVDAEAVEAVCEPEPDQQEQPPEDEAYEAEDIEF